MQRRTALLLVALILAAPAAATTDLAFTVIVDRGEYLAVRVNVTDTNNATLSTQRLGCTFEKGEVEDHMVEGKLEIIDGKFRDQSTWVTSVPPEFFYASVGFGAGHKVAGWGSTQWCAPGMVGTTWLARMDSSYTWVFVNGWKPMTMEIIPSGEGIESVDFVVGRASIKTFTQFDTALGASVGSIPSADAILFATESERISTDTVGWFWPEPTFYTHVGVSWTCEQDGASCPHPIRNNGWMSFDGDGGGDWKFEATGQVQQRYNHGALGLVPLPDDSYLY